MRFVDLALPEDKKPTALSTFDFPSGTVETFANSFFSPKKYAIGSSKPDQKVYHQRDLGLLQCVYESWKNHWNLRTSPEDWWFPVTCRIAKAIDKAAAQGRYKDVVRDYFVAHQSKKLISIDVPVNTIYEVNYKSFMAKMATEIQHRIKVPEFASTMQNDFSSSSATHKIASQINLMASTQQFFEYEMRMCGCGIKGIEFLGDLADWNALVEKLQKLRELLKPILHALDGITEQWLDHVELVFRNLSKTFASVDDPVVADFWADILMVGTGWKYGSSGMSREKAEAYNGWLIEFLLGYKGILAENLLSTFSKKKCSGVNQVPLKITLATKNPPVSDEAHLVAGIVGFQLHADTPNQVPSLEPHHMWALVLSDDSPLRGN